MAKLDTNTLVLEKIVGNPSENETCILNESIHWKMINISKGITEFEKLIASWEQLKTKVANELVSTIIGGAAVNDLQHIDFKFLLDSFSIQIHSKIEN